MTHRIALAVMLLLVGMGSAQAQGRVYHFEDTTVFTAVPFADCGDFQVLGNWELSVHGRDLFDRNGDFINEIVLEKVLGRDLFYNSEDPTKFVVGGPGEGERLTVSADGIMSFSGLVFKIVLPGQGPIFLQTGETIIDTNTGEILLSAGHDDGMSGNTRALCDALR